MMRCKINLSSVFLRYNTTSYFLRGLSGYFRTTWQLSPFSNGSMLEPMGAMIASPRSLMYAPRSLLYKDSCLSEAGSKFFDIFLRFFSGYIVFCQKFLYQFFFCAFCLKTVPEEFAGFIHADQTVEILSGTSHGYCCLVWSEFAQHKPFLYFHFHAFLSFLYSLSIT